MTFDVVPEEPGSCLWSGELTPRPDLDDGGERGFPYRQLRPEDLESELPAVSIGTPEVLRAIASPDPEGFVRLGNHDFYVIRLWCSFRDQHSEIEFDYANFTVSLSTPGVIAHDMYPAEVMYKVEHNVQVSLTPQIKFSEVGGSLGGVDFGFRYTELQPSIVAAGQGQTTPTWSFATVKGYKLRGGKAVHLVVRAPAGTPQCDATFDLVAHVRKPKRLSLPMGLFERRGDVPAPAVSARLW